MKLNIEWTDDCQGKKDYDGDVVAISTRYWPSRCQQNGRVSAKCSIIISDGYPHHNGESEELAFKDFEGETFEQVSAQVKMWAQEQANRVYSALRTEFGKAA